MTSLCSTGLGVRRSDGHPARAHAGVIGSLSRTVQSRIPLGERMRSIRVPQRPAFFLLTAPPPFPFWGAKKKMGVESPQGMPCHHAPFGAAGRRHAVPRAWPPPTKFRPGIWGVGQVVVPYGSISGSIQQHRASGGAKSCFSAEIQQIFPLSWCTMGKTRDLLRKVK